MDPAPPHPPPERSANPLLRLWRSATRLMPAVVTGTADVDPALILTASLCGAVFGYRLLWVIVLALPVLLTVFAVTARLGHESRRGLVELLRLRYGRAAAIGCAALIVLINLAMLVADMAAVTDALSILFDQPRSMFVAIVAFTMWYMLLFHDHARITRLLVFAAVPLFLYVPVALLSGADWPRVARHALLPTTIDHPSYYSAIVALFGALLTPYIVVWQTSARREDALAGRGLHLTQHQMGGIVAGTLAFAVVVSAGTLLRVGNVEDMTIRLAASVLNHTVGEAGTFLFAAGIVGAGLVAMPVLVASLSYSLAEALEWEYGLDTHPMHAARFYVVITLALLSAAVINFFRVDAVKALFFSQVLAGVATVPLLAAIFALSNDERVLQTRNTNAQNFWIATAIAWMVLAGFGLAWVYARG
jgi:Mn2+/Fe2+ NRAMP family transporter